ncbi:Polysaccharide pyruvyl transferase [Cribrihabitans marinus]|uniref:Polysaccharide pyruvyl transferase n=1 Tax=Cribrihabitans marinus TaxID=1227549 RepID=A0A1H6WCB6_9RHOB|nr:polysaccharide pyruvyl transferase family protein [Cribrihabitans marinus]GGH24232.1 exopolysaccharide glucosyl ketal-pyruvate-transferase [Cribrihabitans marinus]SEJ14681.1 Polysaccharide pyruvyl transferase [Cribrihabitans marinus]
MSVDSQAPIRLFWWKAQPNFGDELSPRVVAHLSGRPVVHAAPGDCEMLALGSLLQVMSRNFARPRAYGSKPVIWGAGLLHPAPKRFVGNVEIALLRGPVSAALLDIPARGFGDPGLLADEVFPASTPRRDRIALVPHHSMMGDPALERVVASNPALHLVDPRADAESVCAAISGSCHVISASLHGLVVADAYGVPSTWLRPGAQSHLKFHDYAASVGRAMVAPIELDEVPAALGGLSQSDHLPHEDGIARARSDLKDSFPARFRAVTDTARRTVRA